MKKLMVIFVGLAVCFSFFGCENIENQNGNNNISSVVIEDSRNSQNTISDSDSTSSKKQNTSESSTSNSCNQQNTTSAENESNSTQNTISKDEQVENSEITTNNENNTTTSKPSNEPEPHEHIYTISIVTATCSSDGYTLHKCSCGDEYISNATPKTYRHSFAKNTHPSLGDSYVGNYLGSDKCSLCGLEVIDQGYWRDKDYKKSNVRYYITNDTFVVYGSGTIPGNPLTNSSGENLAPWYDYLNDNIQGFNNITNIIIADGITEISDNSFKFPENANNIKTIYISDSVKKIKKSFSGFNKVIDVRLSHNLEYLGANFSSRDHGKLINKTVLPKTLKYLSRNAFSGSDWLWYEGTQDEFSSIKIIENQSLSVSEWINSNREAFVGGIHGVNYNCTFQ